MKKYIVCNLKSTKTMAHCMSMSHCCFGLYKYDGLSFLNSSGFYTVSYPHLIIVITILNLPFGLTRYGSWEAITIDSPVCKT